MLPGPGRRQQGDILQGWRDAGTCCTRTKQLTPQPRAPCVLWSCAIARSSWFQGHTPDPCGMAGKGAAGPHKPCSSPLLLCGAALSSHCPHVGLPCPRLCAQCCRAGSQAQVRLGAAAQCGQPLQSPGVCTLPSTAPSCSEMLLALPTSKDSRKDFRSNCLCRHKKH